MTIIPPGMIVSVPATLIASSRSISLSLIVRKSKYDAQASVRCRNFFLFFNLLSLHNTRFKPHIAIGVPATKS